MRCTRCKILNCSKSECTRERRDRLATSSPTVDPLADMISPLHQAVYGGPFYGAGSSDTGASSSPASDCSPPSSYDSGSSSSSSGDGGSSSSSSDCGGSW